MVFSAMLSLERRSLLLRICYLEYTFLLFFSAPEPWHGAEWGVGSGVFAAEIAIDGATAIDIAFVD